MPGANRPEWVRAEYERIGREREQASRDADRARRRDLMRVCGEMVGWTVLGLLVAAVAFHVTDEQTGRIFLYGGMVINWGGVLVSVWKGYRRGEARGDW